jgi:CDGSH-type Zn-finger protein
MTSPVRASDTPFAVDVEQGKDYWWCACGQSKAQPFCDGSHKNAV